MDNNMDKQKQEAIKSLALHEKDTGSSEVQISILTDKITYLSEHFKKFKKDKHSSVGLVKAVNRRKRLLEYLKKNNPESYKNVISKLNLRK
jgi:small subunit ribosomal protein S15|tara:strand:- start:1226 stop:1498 length:273 start_codon:yes stop_codon:yes gene_type:complete